VFTDSSIGSEARQKFGWAGQKIGGRADLKRSRAEGVELVSGRETDNILRDARAKIRKKNMEFGLDG
jgi:hypothetical protein